MCTTPGSTVYFTGLMEVTFTPGSTFCATALMVSHYGKSLNQGALLVSVIMATGSTDDLKLRTPSVNAFNILVDICMNISAKYDVMFNAKKSLLIISKCTQSCLLLLQTCSL